MHSDERSVHRPATLYDVCVRGKCPCVAFAIIILKQIALVCTPDDANGFMGASRCVRRLVSKSSVG
jgi:hypothetical protein